MAATILLVEDSSTILNLLNLVMRHAGYRVITAADGLEGLARLAEEPVDLIITDINMPRLDGLGFIARVRKLPGAHQPRIVVLSTESAEFDRQRCLSAGADLYLTKPVSHQELIGQVADQLAKARPA